MTDTTKTSVPESMDQNVESSKDNEQSIDRFPSFGVLISALVVGTYFGIVLTKSEVVRWERVHKMFLFQEAHMYLIIGVGILVALISMVFLKKASAKSVQGKQIEYKPKPFHLGVVIGGMIFGAGWAITGACPGPIYAQIGGGEWMAFITLSGSLIGMFAYAALKPKLPH